MTKFEEGLKNLIKPSLYAVETGIPNIENETQELITQIKDLIKKELVPGKNDFCNCHTEILNRIGG